MNNGQVVKNKRRVESKGMNERRQGGTCQS